MALFTLRQLFFGIFDFRLHSEHFEKLDVVKLWNDLSDTVFGIANTQGSCGASSFGHIMGGYDCGIYY